MDARNPVCAMRLSPKQTCGSQTQCCNQKDPSSLEVITAEFGLEMRRAFQVTTHGHISHSTPYSPCAPGNCFRDYGGEMSETDHLRMQSHCRIIL